jgi:zinc protease
MKDFKPQAAAAKVEAFDATPANLDARTQTFAVGGIKAAVLPKGHARRGGAGDPDLALRRRERACSASARCRRRWLRCSTRAPGR